MTRFQKYAVLGGSRGLGLAFIERVLSENPEAQVLSISRKPEPRNRVQVFECDFSKSDSSVSVALKLKEFSPDVVVCCSAGGPYGKFEDKAWKDHEWAFNVSFFFWARLLHELLKWPTKPSQVILVGSSIAESQADPKAASYSMAKHALLGLYRNLKAENPKWDIRLLSPGYMKTAMLPPNSAPVRDGLAEEPSAVASKLWEWHLDPRAESHLTL